MLDQRGVDRDGREGGLEFGTGIIVTDVKKTSTTSVKNAIYVVLFPYTRGESGGTS